MKTYKIYSGPHHDWFMFGRDPDKPDSIIDTNQYLIVNKSNALLMDPGGIELFAPMLANIVKQVPVEQITHVFASHQDPDIISSLGLWDQILENATLYAPTIWEGFLRHFGMSTITFDGIKDEGRTVNIGSTEVQFIPAHYLHSSGNFNVYDPEAKILMSGDIGASLEPHDAGLEVEDFEKHTQYMTAFHRRWMPSNSAKNNWVERVSRLDIAKMCPQHGRVFVGDDVKRFLDWFAALEVGQANGF